ncbi:extracellular solute-binding protein family 5 [Parafrankia sp. EAN1pec]|uniref:ABC transporter substrate-binding protein n=1 Tax=Parafrankia sp. (strain EAN1pec) TaxID=298653 RepID=UPI0000544F07|nr:extracellular solute-binding protein family 5 [Frankia sp. EAN1pec]
MFRKSRLVATAVVCGAALALGACGGGGGDDATSSTNGAAGQPVAGGEGRILLLGDPRSLDPATLSNQAAITAPVGNALYGTLMITDQAGKVKYTMAESFDTTDTGKTFTLKLKHGLVFSDGKPLNAEAVKFNWDRIKDPTVGSSYVVDARMIESTEVVDDVTLKVTMVNPVPAYAQAVLNSSLNWIASPDALKAGRDSFDKNPIGAGPFTLASWTRQADIKFVKNPKYWDAPKPYLDRLTMRSATDATQRLNTVISGGADVAIDTNTVNIDKAETSDLNAVVTTLNGGNFMAFNSRRAPFDDIRARQAVSAAIDLEALNLAAYNGTAPLPDTLFDKSSPLFSDTPLHKTDKALAQKLLDELAADGKPVKFTFSSFPSSENRAIAENIQAQLSAFKNITVSVKIVDLGQVAALRTTFDFDLLVSSASFQDPEPRLWQAFSQDSVANLSGVKDKELSDALLAGRTATTEADRKAAYETVQERLVALSPVVFYQRSTNAAIGTAKVGGIVQYGSGSLLVEELWIKK